MVQIFDVTGVKKRAQNLAKLYDEILIAQRIGLKYVNSKHKYIELTEEHEGNDKLSFIDKVYISYINFINLFTENPLSVVF